MIKKLSKGQPEQEKLNLIPIMDAVFIFIFFLLFSAQFIKIFEINSDAPVVSEVPDEIKNKKEPLNLKVKIEKNRYVITRGFDDKVLRTFPIIREGGSEVMKNFLLEIRKKNPDDNYVIIVPGPNTSYESIIEVTDIVKLLPEGVKELKIRVKGKDKTFSKLFEQIVLEPI